MVFLPKIERERERERESLCGLVQKSISSATIKA